MPSIVVTGATRGLGRGMAAALGARGCRVTLTGRNVADAENVAAELAALMPDGRYFGARCDVRYAAEVDALAAAAITKFGAIDAWVNNAGLALTGASLEALGSNNLSLMVDINLHGTVNGCRTAARAMRTRGGTIVNVHGAGSDGRPVPGMIAYATTKRAVQFFTTAIAAELAGSAVTVAAISPGLVLTDGFFREYAKTPLDLRPARDAAVNILADDVSAVADWAARIILSKPKHGREYRWLTPAKLRRRALMVPPRDVLAPYRDADGLISALATAP